MSREALIIEPDPARAAQFSHLLERKGLQSFIAQTRPEAIFAAGRLRSLSVIILEAAMPEGDGLEILRDLRQGVRAQAPAIVLVDSREAYDAAARVMISLGITAILPQAGRLGAVDDTITRTLKLGTPPSLPPPPPAGLRPAAEQTAQRTRPLKPAERLLAAAGMRAIAPEEIQRVATVTAQALGVAIALVWLDQGGRSFFKLHAEREVPENSPLRYPHRWMRVREMIGDALLHVEDVTEHRAFSRDPLLPGGLAASLAGAPLTAAGVVVGAIAIVQPHVVGRLGADLVAALGSWAQRISGDLELFHAGAEQLRPFGSPTLADRSSASLSQASALVGAARSFEFGLLVSDAKAIVCFANPAATALLGARTADVLGHPRADVVGRLGEAAGVDQRIVSAIVGAPLGQDAAATFAIDRPTPRILRWRGRQVDLGGGNGRTDEFHDVTREQELLAAQKGLVRIDADTGLPNRAALDEALGREIARALRTEEPLALVVFTIDDAVPPPVEPAADLLRNVAWLLRATARGYDFVACLDDGELVAILPSATEHQATAFAGRFSDEVRKMGARGLPRATVSGAVAQFDRERSIDEILADSRRLLAEAKRQGGDRILAAAS